MVRGGHSPWVASSTSRKSAVGAPGPAPPLPFLRMPPPSRATGEGLAGLANLGNTCFLNSTLQCLNAVRGLSAYFLSSGLADDVASGRATSLTLGKVAEAYAELVRSVWAAGAPPGRVLSPSTLRRVVGDLAPRFRTYDQQDSHEVLRFLVDALSEDTNRLPARAPYRELSDPRAASDAEVGDAWWRYDASRCDSFPRDLFAGQMKTCTQCPSCGAVSRAFDSIWDLQLPIPSAAALREGDMWRLRGAGGTLPDTTLAGLRAAGAAAAGGADEGRPPPSTGLCTVRHCLAELTAVETMVEPFKCTACNVTSPSGAQKTLSVHRAPRILVLQIRRFLNRRVKLGTAVTFPVRGLSLAPYMTGGACPGLPMYDLFAVSSHFGHLGSGHYVADAMGVDDVWRRFDDSTVSETQVGAIDACGAYVLFYARREGSAPSV